MTTFLLDTNVVSEGIRPRPDRKVQAFLLAAQNASVSVITVHELVFGAERLPMGARRASVIASIEMLRRSYSNSIYPVREAEAVRAGLLRASAAGLGRALHFADALILATAAVNAFTLVTRNVRDFEGLGVDVINPFAD